MEQEETKTTAAAGVEMPPEAESWVQLHESELTELMQKQAKAAITELKRQEKQERGRSLCLYPAVYWLDWPNLV